MWRALVRKRHAPCAFRLSLRFPAHQQLDPPRQTVNFCLLPRHNIRQVFGQFLKMGDAFFDMVGSVFHTTLLRHSAPAQKPSRLAPLSAIR